MIKKERKPNRVSSTRARPHHVSRRHRNHRTGIALITVLIAVILLSGSVLVLQSRSLVSTIALKSLTREINRNTAGDAAINLLRPLLAEVFLQPESVVDLVPNSTPFEISALGQSVNAEVQDVDSLIDVYRTDLSQLGSVVSREVLLAAEALQRESDIRSGLTQRLGAASIEITRAKWFTDKSKLSNPNQTFMPREYLNSLSSEPTSNADTVRILRISIH